MNSDTQGLQPRGSGRVETVGKRDERLRLGGDEFSQRTLVGWHTGKLNIGAEVVMACHAPFACYTGLVGVDRNQGAGG